MTYPSGEEMVTQLYFEGHNTDGFNGNQRNQVKELVPDEVVGGRVTFHIYPENFASLQFASCPF